jgi:hypothetical protein
MTARRLERPRDPIPLGKLIGDIATGQVEDRVEDGKDPVLSELGRKAEAVWKQREIAVLADSALGEAALES